LKREGGTKREAKPPTKGQHSKSQINQWKTQNKATWIFQIGLCGKPFTGLEKMVFFAKCSFLWVF